MPHAHKIVSRQPSFRRTGRVIAIVGHDSTPEYCRRNTRQVRRSATDVAMTHSRPLGLRYFAEHFSKWSSTVLFWIGFEKRNPRNSRLWSSPSIRPWLSVEQMANRCSTINLDSGDWFYSTNLHVFFKKKPNWHFDHTGFVSSDPMDSHITASRLHKPIKSMQFLYISKPARASRALSTYRQQTLRNPSLIHLWLAKTLTSPAFPTCSKHHFRMSPWMTPLSLLRHSHRRTSLVSLDYYFHFQLSATGWNFFWWVLLSRVSDRL